ncbi:hypothetical protein BX661DRAFT_195590 [Kickxella alabastrina]|uniref:uncharacterized protein n=1 Tax=Kickxella alabastrina TaxID=61397 RepID=UPI00221F9C21|nr:uncharacterized protein BX661DRAFT_195590 [Kickxella alabastrina]KAI7835033.1 hypothetical protein BX661DRAFT_195590 [Kickxella alabastrina]KAJ1947662.1 hypothetical protein GGF37_000245 [Kickxella alabastrina]
MDTESLYWDQYDTDTDYMPQATVPIQEVYYARPSLQQYRQPPEHYSSDHTSSRGSYWSKYLGTQFASDQCTPTKAGSDTPRMHSTMDIRRLLVMPEKLASLHLSSEDGLVAATKEQGARLETGQRKLVDGYQLVDAVEGAGRGIFRAIDSPSSDSVSGQCAKEEAASSGISVGMVINGNISNSGGSGGGGVNPMALITRLNFLKDQMEQDERLVLNYTV